VAALCASFRQIDEREIRAGERQALLALADAISPSRQISGSGGPHIGGIVAAHVMRSRPRAVRPGDTLARAAELMDLGAVRELPVVDGEALCGILSRTDIQPHLGHLEWTRVEAAMTSEPVVVTPAQSAAAISRTLVQGCYNAVPVVADEATLVGMVSRSDLLRAVVSDANGDGR
jgi:CBS domain-containing protein